MIITEEMKEVAGWLPDGWEPLPIVEGSGYGLRFKTVKGQFLSIINGRVMYWVDPSTCGLFTYLKLPITKVAFLVMIDNDYRQ